MVSGLDIKAILPKIRSGSSSAAPAKKENVNLNEVKDDTAISTAKPEEVLEYQKTEELEAQQSNQKVIIEGDSQSRFDEAVIVSESPEISEEQAALNYLTEDAVKLQESLQLQMQLTELQNTDRQVKIHEQAHKNAGGVYASAPVYEYTIGPDGQQYAVGGSVSIDTSVVANNPEATIDKMEIVKRAALAPVDPSPQDHAVAAKATMAQIEARSQIAQDKLEENSNNEPKTEIEKIIARYTQAFEPVEQIEEFFYIA